MTTNFSPRKRNTKLSNIFFPNSTFTRNIHLFAENVLLLFQNIFLTRCCLAVLFFTIFAHTTYNVNKSVVYSNFLEAVQSFVRQYNILLLSFTYLDPVFLCWLKIYIFFSFISIF